MTGERMERMSKADEVQAAESLKRASKAGPGDKIDQGEVDTLAAAQVAALPTGEAAIGDGRAPGQAADGSIEFDPDTVPEPVVQTFKGKAGATFAVPTDGDWPEPTGAMPILRATDQELVRWVWAGNPSSR